MGWKINKDMYFLYLLVQEICIREHSFKSIKNSWLKYMKQSKLLTFVLIPIAALVMTSINIYSADATADKPATTADKPATAADKPATAADKPATAADKPATTADKPATTADKPAADGKADDTIAFIGVGLGILNSIGLATLFLLNKKAINKIKERARNSEQRIESLKSKDQSLDTHIKKVDSDRQNSSHTTAKEIEGLKRSLEELSRRSASIQQSASSSQSNYRNERHPSPSERYTPEPVYRQLSHTDYYNDRQSDFQNKYQITAVSRETENFNQSRAAQTDSVVLAGDRQGNYWLFSDNSEIYLVPKQNLKITDNRISNTKDLFECQDYNEQNYDNFVLVKPAVLVAQGNGNWQLKEKGKLQFG